MKILLFGKNGQVGRRLYNVLLPLGELVALGSSDLDLRDFDKLRECIRHHKPDVIVNAAGYTDVDKAESDHDSAFAINAEAVRVIAEEVEEIGAWLVHYSTDYVFDGSKNGAYTEDDKPNPLSVYGRSKLAGDEYISSISKLYIILRTSWVFDSYGKNFPKTIMALAKKNDSLRIIDDQVGSPTHASLIANVTAFVLYKIMSLGTEAKSLRGVYNLSSSEKVSWCGFANALIKAAGEMGCELKCLPENIAPIGTKDYLTPAKRPMNSRLDSSKLVKTFEFTMPRWEVYIHCLIEELKAMTIL